MRRAALLLFILAPLAAYVALGRGERALAGGRDVPQAARPVFELELVTDALKEPVHLTAPAGERERLFVCEKGGRVRIVRAGKVAAEPFLDVAKRVSRGSEQGLLSLAFHPKYAENGRFFIYFTDRKGDIRVVERRRAKADADGADPEWEREILTIEHRRFANHDGGLAVFGPDGKLYVGTGDGGGGGDPFGNGQNPGALLAKLLRLDVDAADGKPYAIPRDNPFVGRAGFRPEIWAWGLRNPWRFTFDRETGDLYIADVGQDKWEEVDVAPAASRGGENYGWSILEGNHRFRGGETKGLVAPAVEYAHDVGCSVIGGAVYRGAAIPELRGAYFYADYCTGVIRSFRWSAGKVTEHVDWTALVNPRLDSKWTSFGEDARGEMYLLSQDGPVYRFAPVPGALK